MRFDGNKAEGKNCAETKEKAQFRAMMLAANQRHHCKKRLPKVGKCTTWSAFGPDNTDEHSRRSHQAFLHSFTFNSRLVWRSRCAYPSKMHHTGTDCKTFNASFVISCMCIRAIKAHTIAHRLRWADLMACCDSAGNPLDRNRRENVHCVVISHFNIVKIRCRKLHIKS